MRPSAQIIALPQASFSGKMPRKPRNKDVRTREYLTPEEVDKVMIAAGRVGRHGFRDRTLVLLAYAMPCGSQNWSRSAGTKSISSRGICIFEEQRTVWIALIPCAARNCAP